MTTLTRITGFLRIRFENRKLKWILGMLLTLICPLSCWWFGYSVTAGLVLMAAAAGVTVIRFEIPDEKLLTMVNVMLFPLVSFLGFIIGIVMQNLTFSGITVALIMINTILHMIFQLVILLLSKRVRLSVVLGFLIPFAFTLINAYVYLFRGNAFTPFDLLSLRTAANVASDYNLTPNAPMLYALLMAAIVVTGVYCVPALPDAYVARKKHLPACAAVVCVCVILFNIPRYSQRNWDNNGAGINGYLFNFLLQMKSIYVEVPDGYSPDTVEELSLGYPQENVSFAKPDIIVIMDESFADFRVFDNENDTLSVMPYMDAMSGDTIHGYLTASVFGGSTANSEYEFLSGSTMGFLPQGSIVYQQYYTEDSWTLVSYLKSLGYDCIAMHPYHANGWMRDRVYPQMGFDSFLALEDFPQKQMLREYVSDREMFERIIALHKSQEEDVPFFLFGITMQNHGSYTYDGADFQPTVTLADYPQAGQYLSLAKETDRAVEYLIEHYKTVDRDTVIVFFGDHMPNVEAAFYEHVHDGGFDTLDEKMKKQMVPFFIWANFDIEEQNISCSSINYLPLYTLEAAGIPLPPYLKFLKDIEAVVPAINAFGYYSVENQCFLPLEDANGAEAEVIHLYEILQYNNLFGDEDRSGHFFGK